MSLHNTSYRYAARYLLITLSFVAVFFLLYVFRYADDNRLTSWQWTFAQSDVSFFPLILIACGVVAYVVSRFSFPERMPALFLFFSSYAMSVLFWGEPEVIVDASRYFTQAKHLGTDMPFVPFLYGLIFRFFGESRVYVQLFTTFLFSLTVVFTYGIGTTLWDRQTGFTGGLLLLGIPYLLTQTPLMLIDVPTMFFLTLSTFMFIRALEKGRAQIALSSLAIFLCFFSKYSTWLMLSVLVVIFLVYLVNPIDRGLRRRTVLQRSIAIAYVACILIGVLIFLKLDVFSRQIDLLLEFQRPGLRRWGESFVSTFLFQTHPFITISALFAVFVSFRKRDIKFLIPFWLILLVIVLQIKRSRYVLIMFPMFTLMASYGFQKMRDSGLRRFIVFYVVMASLSVAFFSYLPFLKTMGLVNLKQAGGFLNSVREERIDVVTLPAEETTVNPAVAVPLIDLFTDKKIYYHHDRGVTLPFERIKASPVRFTWEYKNPEYYTDIGKGSTEEIAVAVISNRHHNELPAWVAQRLKEYRKTAIFNSTTGLFRYIPVVVIYQKKGEIW
jgi:4-amino-4-deoxy-L-arabinose transferase-like glycosyltransferase